MSNLKPLQRLLLLQLIEHMPHCSPSVTRLAARTGCSRRAVMTRLSELEQAGWLRVTRRFGARSEYEVTPPNQCTTCTGEDSAPVRLAARTGARRAQTGARRAPKADLSRKKPDSAASEPLGEGTPTVFRDLNGWEIPAELFVEAELDYGISRERLAARVDELRNRPIGGQTGVFDRTAYVRARLREWKLWEETDRAKARAARALKPMGEGSIKRPGLTGPAARKVLEEFE